VQTAGLVGMAGRLNPLGRRSELRVGLRSGFGRRFFQKTSAIYVDVG